MTAAGHGLAAGDVAYLEGLGGLSHANGQTVEVVSVSGNDVVLRLDTRPMGTYTSGGTIRQPLRTLAVTAPTASYTAAEQSADFGSPQSSIKFALYQQNDAGTRGYPTVEVL